jgi:hypothetical protein
MYLQRVHTSRLVILPQQESGQGQDKERDPVEWEGDQGKAQKQDPVEWKGDQGHAQEKDPVEWRGIREGSGAGSVGGGSGTG